MICGLSGNLEFVAIRQLKSLQTKGEMEKRSVNFFEDFWKQACKMICSGKTAQVSFDEIYAMYGHCAPVSKLLKLMQIDDMKGGSPACIGLFV